MVETYYRYKCDFCGKEIKDKSLTLEAWAGYSHLFKISYKDNECRITDFQKEFCCVSHFLLFLEKKIREDLRLKKTKKSKGMLSFAENSGGELSISD